MGGDWWVNYRSRARGLLALYLFSDVDVASAPTPGPARLAPGRHPRIMAQPGVALHDAFPLVPPLSPVELAMSPERAA